MTGNHETNHLGAFVHRADMALSEDCQTKEEAADTLGPNRFTAPVAFPVQGYSPDVRELFEQTRKDDARILDELLWADIK